MKLLPSLPAQSFGEIQELTAALAGVASEVQIDIVDGQFVPLLAWPFTEADPRTELLKLKQISSAFELEIDCMVIDPEQYFEIFKEIQPRRIIVHFGSTENHSALKTAAEAAGWKLGLAFTNDADMEVVKSLLPLYDYAQIMGIREVGQQGQPFDERTPETVRMLKAEFPDLEIAVDGSVNAETIPVLKEAGVERFAPGSAIAKQSDQKTAFLNLQSLLAG